MAKSYAPDARDPTKAKGKPKLVKVSRRSEKFIEELSLFGTSAEIYPCHGEGHEVCVSIRVVTIRDLVIPLKSLGYVLAKEKR